MATTIGQIRAKISAEIGEFKANMREADKSLARFEKSAIARSRKFEKAGKRMQGIGKSLFRNLTLPMVAVGSASVVLASSFETSMKKIETLVGIAGSEVAKMKDGVLALSGTTAKSPHELAEALFVVTSAGLRGAKAMETLDIAAKASASGLGETKVIARALTGILTSYKDSNLSAAEAGDQLLTVVRAGNLEASELAPVLGRVTGIASQLGISFAEVGASIATFTRLGVSSEEAVTGLRGVINSIVKDSPAASKALGTVGLTFKDLREQIKEKGLTKTLLNLVKLFKGNEAELAKVIPNVRAFSALLGTAGAQGEDYAEILDQIENSTGNLSEAFEDTTSTSAFKFKQALANLQAAGIKLGTALLPIATRLADAIGGLAESFSGLSDETQKTILVTAGLVAGIAPLLIGIGSMSRGIGSMIVLSSKLAKAIRLMNVAMLASPWGLVAGAVVAVGIGVAAYVKSTNKATAATRALAGVQKEMGSLLKDEKSELQKLLAIAKNDNLSKETRRKAIKRLNDISPEYLGNLTLESINTNKATMAVGAYVKSLERKARVLAISNKLTDIEGQLIHENAKEWTDNADALEKGLLP